MALAIYTNICTATAGIADCSQNWHDIPETSLVNTQPRHAGTGFTYPGGFSWYTLGSSCHGQCKRNTSFLNSFCAHAVVFPLGKCSHPVSRAILHADGGNALWVASHSHVEISGNLLDYHSLWELSADCSRKRKNFLYHLCDLSVTRRESSCWSMRSTHCDNLKFLSFQCDCCLLFRGCYHAKAIPTNVSCRHLLWSHRLSPTTFTHCVLQKCKHDE